MSDQTEGQERPQPWRDGGMGYIVRPVLENGRQKHQRMTEEYANALEQQVTALTARLVEEAQRGLANGKARLKAEAERDRLREQVDELKAALENLIDVQNGPPLVKYEKDWQAAMDAAAALLDPAPQGGTTS